MAKSRLSKSSDVMFNRMKEVGTAIDRVARWKTDKLRSRVYQDVVGNAQREFKAQAAINLTDYSATGSAPRHKTIEKAFEYISAVYGTFDWNPKGSYTDEGADERIKNDLQISSGKTYFKIEVVGLLKELEQGIVNWKNLKRFFFSKSNQYALIYMFGEKEIADFQRDLQVLFRSTKDPTMPNGRKYMGTAAFMTSKYIDEDIRENIEEVFGSEGVWEQG